MGGSRSRTAVTETFTTVDGLHLNTCRTVRPGTGMVVTRRNRPPSPSPESHTIFAPSSRSRDGLLTFSGVHWLVASGRRERSWDFSWAAAAARAVSGGPSNDAASVTRCGTACQAGEARAFAAAARRVATSPQVTATGEPDAMAILMRRTLIVTKAPIFRSLRRMVPQVAFAQ